MKNLSVIGRDCIKQGIWSKSKNHILRRNMFSKYHFMNLGYLHSVRSALHHPIRVELFSTVWMIQLDFENFVVTYVAIFRNVNIAGLRFKL